MFHFLKNVLMCLARQNLKIQSLSKFFLITYSLFKCPDLSCDRAWQQIWQYTQNKFQMLLLDDKINNQNNKGFMTCWLYSPAELSICEVSPSHFTPSSSFYTVYLGRHCAQSILGSGELYSPTLRAEHLHKVFGIFLHKRFFFFSLIH